MASTVRKVSVAIGRDALAWAEGRARREGSSVSAVLTQAARSARDAEREDARRRKAWKAFLHAATKGRGLDAAALARGLRELDEK